MGSIKKDTYQKLVLLYLVGNFKDGIYSSYRFQKVLYFGTKETDIRPFSFVHTEYGQYSYRAREVLDSLEELGLINRTGLPIKKDDGARWVIAHEERKELYNHLFQQISNGLAVNLNEIVDKCGYLSSEQLKAYWFDRYLFTTIRRGGTSTESW